jgi:histidyl-tRNA synthetase
MDSLFDSIVQFTAIRSVETLKKFFEARNLLGFKGVLERISELSLLINALAGVGVSDYVAIDFEIVRGLAYYTGFVFEFFHRSLASRALAGGGTYDSLTKKLSYGSIPVVGLAIGDVTLCDLLREKNLLPELEKNTDCFVIFDEISKTHAVKLDNELRHGGFAVEYALHDISFGKQLRMASQNGAKFALICGENECSAGVVKVKNLLLGNEATVEESKLGEFLAKE